MAADSVQKIRGFRHLMLNDTSASGFRQIKPILHFKTSAASERVTRAFAVALFFRGGQITNRTNSCNWRNGH